MAADTSKGKIKSNGSWTRMHTDLNGKTARIRQRQMLCERQLQLHATADLQLRA
jgi:hypothetical protein